MRERLTENARDVGAYLQERMHATFDGDAMVGEVRGIGLLNAVEFVADPEKKERFDPNLKVGPRLSAAAAKEGLITRAMPHGDILGFAPPLTITRDEVDTVVAKTKKAVDAVREELTREGALKAA
jgi:L-2,4-diaminobutyrate transaminase